MKQDDDDDITATEETDVAGSSQTQRQLKDADHGSITAPKSEEHGQEKDFLRNWKALGERVTLIDCVNNYLLWTGQSVGNALKAVTSTPAAMLGISATKGTLNIGADPDLVILSEYRDAYGHVKLDVDEVWKSGFRVWTKKPTVWHDTDRGLWKKGIGS